MAARRPTTGVKNPFAPRIRAARGYAGLHQSELADALGHDAKTQMRRESEDGEPPRRAEIIAIAVVCGVPLQFIRNGWGDFSPEYGSAVRAALAAERLVELRGDAPRGANGESEPDPPEASSGPRPVGRRNSPR